MFYSRHPLILTTAICILAFAGVMLFLLYTPSMYQYGGLFTASYIAFALIAYTVAAYAAYKQKRANQDRLTKLYKALFIVLAGLSVMFGYISYLLWTMPA